MIEEKKSAVTQALFDCAILRDSANNCMKSAKNSAQSEYRFNSDIHRLKRPRRPLVFYTKKEETEWKRAQAEWEKKEKSIEKERENAIKAAEKSYDSDCRIAKKNCNDRLKQLFVELEIDMKRFYKGGISKEYLLDFIEIIIIS